MFSPVLVPDHFFLFVKPLKTDPLVLNSIYVYMIYLDFHINELNAFFNGLHCTKNYKFLLVNLVKHHLTRETLMQSALCAQELLFHIQAFTLVM